MQKTSAGKEEKARLMWASYRPDQQEVFWKKYEKLIRKTQKKTSNQKIVSTEAALPSISLAQKIRATLLAFDAAFPQAKPVIMLSVAFLFILIGLLNTINFHPQTSDASDKDLISKTNSTNLDLSNHNLFALPSEIGQQTHLTSLELQNNYLASLPAEMEQLQHLQWLDLQKNGFVVFPKEIATLRQLEWLYLNHNQLKSMPHNLAKLQRLQWLFLNDNELSHYPMG